MKCNLTCTIGKTKLKNPVVTASGTFGFGEEYSSFYNIGKLGGITTKGLTLNPKEGNAGRRLFETAGGMMNSIGLQNPGVGKFVDNYDKMVKSEGAVVIANLGGNTLEEYIKGAELLNNSPVDIVEVNISCPNVKQGGMAFGIKDEEAYKVVKKIREHCEKDMVVKLSPQAENIVTMAKACEEAGADAISLINTVKAMAIDIKSRKPVFKNTYAGLSGPAVKPIALRMVHEVCKNINVPVIGMGGITTWEDAIEFIMAGAECVAVGSGNFYNPTAAFDIVEGIEEFLIKEGIKNIKEIRGII